MEQFTMTAPANIEDVMKYAAFPSIDLNLANLVVSLAERKIEGIDTLSQRQISIYPLSDMDKSAIVILWEKQHQELDVNLAELCQGKLNIHLNDRYIACLEQFYKR